jgi:hypothetical protein
MTKKTKGASWLFFVDADEEEYWQIGGRKAVRPRIPEDVWLGYEVNRHGGRHMTVDLSFTLEKLLHLLRACFIISLLKSRPVTLILSPYFVR